MTKQSLYDIIGGIMNIEKSKQDICPVCGGEAISYCNCPRNERYCVKNHSWRILPDGKKIMVNHHRDKGKPIE